MSVVIIKIKPIPPNTTQADIHSKIPSEWIDSVVIDNVDHFAYIKLKGPQYLEAFAGKFGEEFVFPVWMAKGELIEDEGFDWQGLADSVKNKAHELQAQAAEAVQAGSEKLAQVASDVKDKAETLGSQVQDKVEQAKEKIADVAANAGEKLAEHVETAKQAASDAADTVKEKANQAKENISQGIDKAKEAVSGAAEKAADKVGSVLQSTKAAVNESARGCADALKELEDKALPIETLPPKHRSRLIEFVLLVWLFSVMI